MRFNSRIKTLFILFVRYQAELEEKVSDLDNKLTSREETLKKYISMLESLRDNLKKRSTRNNQTNFQTSLHSSNDLEFDVSLFMFLYFLL